MKKWLCLLLMLPLLTKAQIVSTYIDSSQIKHPGSIALDCKNNLYVVSTEENRVYKIDSVGNITVAVGSEGAGYNGDSIAATSAMLNYPLSVAVNDIGELFIADFNN